MKQFITKNEYEYSKEMFYSMYLYNVKFKVSNKNWILMIINLLNDLGLPLKSVSWTSPTDYGKCSISKYLTKSELSINDDYLICLYSSINQKYIAENYFKCEYICDYWYDTTKSNIDISIKIAKTALSKISLHPKEFYKIFLTKICDSIFISYGIYFKGTHEFQHTKYPKDIFINYTGENIDNWYFNYWNRYPKETDKKDNHTCAPNLHLVGWFRKIYELNIITEKHLHKKINGITLDKWIRSSDINGKLEKIDTKIYLWEIQEQEIYRIEKDLSKENLIIADDNFDWNKIKIVQP